MVRITVLFAMTLLVSALTGCSGGDAGAPAASGKKDVKSSKFHGDAAPGAITTTKTPVADAVKKNKLGGYPMKTVGEAFDSYTRAESKEWREDVAGDGSTYYVDYICWFAGKISADEKSAGAVKKGLDIKFIKRENGDAYVAMANRLLMLKDGKVQSRIIPLPEVAKIVDAIYANRDLDF